MDKNPPTDIEGVGSIPGPGMAHASEQLCPVATTEACTPGAHASQQQEPMQ